MHVLLLVTAHNSLSQRVALLLSDLSQPPPPFAPLPISTSFASEQRFQAGPSTPNPDTFDANGPQPKTPSRITYTIELASTPSTIIEAVRLAKPDVIVCPFLTKRVPREVYAKYLTLILHPGPPGDAGPSALDWVLSGDDGTEPDADIALKNIMKEHEWHSDGSTQKNEVDVKGKGKEGTGTGRREWWGVTCLQAEEELDEGPTWAFEQFRIPPTATKSSLYRDGVTSAACLAIITALNRIEKAQLAFECSPPPLMLATPQSYSRGRMSTAQSMMTIRESASGIDNKTDLFNSHQPRYQTTLIPPADSATHTTRGHPSQIAHTQHRPLLKPAERAPNPAIHTAEKCASLIRAGDSQPGVLTKMFGNKGIFIYGAHIQQGGKAVIEQLERIMGGRQWDEIPYGQIIATRQGAVLIKTNPGSPDAVTPQGLALWITHARLPMPKETKLLPPKLPACDALVAAGLKDTLSTVPEWDLGTWQKVLGTFQQVWVEEERLECPEGGSALYVHWDFYNGACATDQCRLLLEAIIESVDHAQEKVRVLCLMGSRNYFSNGIALNVIEGHTDPSAESWRNINAIDDIVELILGDSSPDGKIYRSEFLRGVPSLAERGILTVSAIQANAAAGGLALATCADVVLCSANAVLNPHYRGVGLFGSEFHTYHWPARVGQRKFAEMAKAMVPISPHEAQNMGLVDRVLGSRLSDHNELEHEIKKYVRELAWARAGEVARHKAAPWVQQASNTSSFPGLAIIDAFIANKLDNHSTLSFPLVFYRNEELSQMLLDFYHPSRSERYHSRRQAFVRKFTSRTTPLRFAEHRRFRSDGLTHKHDPEELAIYEYAPGWVRGEEWRWAKECVPEGFLGFGGLSEIYAQFGGRDPEAEATESDKRAEIALINFKPLPPVAATRSTPLRKAVALHVSDDHARVDLKQALSGSETDTAVAPTAVIQPAPASVPNDRVSAAAPTNSLPQSPYPARDQAPLTGKRDSRISFGQAAPAVHRYVPTSHPGETPSTISALIETRSPPQSAMIIGGARPGLGRSHTVSYRAPDQATEPMLMQCQVGPAEEHTGVSMETMLARPRKTSTWGLKGRSSRRPSSSSGAMTPPSGFGSSISSTDRSVSNGSSAGGSGFRGSIRKALGLRESGNKMDTARFEAMHAGASQGSPTGAIVSSGVASAQNSKKMQGQYHFVPAVVSGGGSINGTLRENQPATVTAMAPLRKSLDASLFARARVVSVEGKDGRVIMTHGDTEGHPEVMFPCYYMPMADVGEAIGAPDRVAYEASAPSMGLLAVADEA